MYFYHNSYGTEGGVGGLVEVKSGSVDIVSGSQTYDLNSMKDVDVSESGKNRTTKSVL